jgi:hypothetical protein
MKILIPVIAVLLCGCSNAEEQGIPAGSPTVASVMVALNDKNSFMALVTSNKQDSQYRNVMDALPPTGQIGVVEAQFETFRVVASPGHVYEVMLVPNNYSIEHRWVAFCSRKNYREPKSQCLFLGMSGASAVEIFGRSNDLTSFDKLQAKVAEAIATSAK